LCFCFLLTKSEAGEFRIGKKTERDLSSCGHAFAAGKTGMHHTKVVNADMCELRTAGYFADGSNARRAGLEENPVKAYRSEGIETWAVRIAGGQPGWVFSARQGWLLGFPSAGKPKQISVNISVRWEPGGIFAHDSCIDRLSWHGKSEK
jgi:hypothetical protein